MDVGDWPAWIALVSAIFSPVITVYLNNRHQEKMEYVKLRSKEIKEISIAIEEILRVSKIAVKDFQGFSESVLSCISFCSKEEIADFFYVIRFLNVRSNSEKKIHDLSIPMSQGEAMLYSDWAWMICEKFMQQRNALLSKKSLLRKAQKPLSHLFSHQKTHK